LGLKKKKTNFIKIIPIITVIIIIIILIYGGIEQSKYNYSLNSFSVTFNGETNDNITAITAITMDSDKLENKIFKKHFEEDIQIMSQKIDGVYSISIENWLINYNKCYIVIDYEILLSSNKKNEILSNIKSSLNSKWYVEGIETKFNRGILLGVFK